MLIVRRDYYRSSGKTVNCNPDMVRVTLDLTTLEWHRLKKLLDPTDEYFPGNPK